MNLYSQDGALVLDGLVFPAVWLRDNCPCRGCRDPGSGQRLVDVLDIPDDVSVCSVDALPGPVVRVTYAPDGHESRFPLESLTASGPDDSRTAAGKDLWPSADLDVPWWSWSRYLEDRRPALSSVQRAGFALLRSVPVDDGMVARVAETFGFVRETNYGRVFDVRAEPDPENLANSALEITPHTDNPYRDPVPTIQLLHCLRNAAAGGDTGLVDGFAAASSLRASHPDEFAVLSSIPRSFEYRAAGVSLRAVRPVIELDSLGRIRGVRFNNRSAGPVSSEVERYYRAYRTWTTLLRRPSARLTLRLEPGDCLIFDNTRILHARTAFTASGSRHLQGCYADLDGLESTLALLDGAPPARRLS